jgi:hypothetical protein
VADKIAVEIVAVRLRKPGPREYVAQDLPHLSQR